MCTKTTRDVGVARQLNGCALVQPLAQDKPVVLFVVRQPSAGSSQPRSPEKLQPRHPESRRTTCPVNI